MLENEEDKPVTKRQLRSELERFRIDQQTERLEKQARRDRYIQMILMVIMALTIYFLLLMRLVEWKLAK